MELLERDAELATLDTFLERTAAGTPGLLAVEGDAGIGKTSLLGVAAARAAELGCLVLTARGSLLERASGFGVVRQLLAGVVALAPAEQARELLSGAAHLAAPVLGVAGEEQLPGDELAAMHGLYWLLARLCDASPVCLVVDDLQWSDEVSTRWLAYVLHRVLGLAVGIVVGVRSGDPDGAYDLVGELTLRPEAVLVRPSPLGADAAAEVIARVRGSRVDQDFAEACRERTGGNPLLLTELVNELAALDVSPVSASIPRVHAVVPDNITQVTLRRLARLPEEALALAQACAVLGPRAELHQAAELAGIDLPTATVAGDVLVDAHILSPDGTLDLVHPLVGSVIHAGIPPHRRGADHRRAAALLDADGAPLERVSQHLLQSPPARDPWVVDRLEAAARLELARGSGGTAAALLERALLEPPAAGERSRLHLALGQAQLRAQDPALFASLQAAIDTAATDGDRTEAALVLAGVWLFAGAPTLVVDLLTPVTEVLPVTDDRRRQAEAMILSAARMSSDLLPLAEERSALIDATSLPGTTGGRLLSTQLSYGAAMRGEPVERAITLARAAIDGQRHLLADLERPDLLLVPVSMLAICDELDEAEQVYAAADQVARAEGRTLSLAGINGLRSWSTFLRGHLREAELQARDALEAAEGSPALGAISGFATSHLVHALLDQGLVDQADAALGAPADGVASLLTWDRNRLFATAAVRAAQGRTAEALELLEACGQSHLQAGITNPAFLPWRSQTALVLHRLGRPDEALVLATEEVGLARVCGAARPLGEALRVAGQLTGDVALLTEAVDVLRRSPARLSRAVALLALGRATSDRGLLLEAHELAVDGGAGPLADELDTELRRSGDRPRLSVHRRADALTASEHRVAAMAASGMSNPQIAQALFVTRATVESHLHSTYRKLGIASRAHLSEALGQRTA